MKYLFLTFLFAFKMAHAEAPIVVFDYDGSYILSPEVAEAAKVLYVGGALAMDRLYKSRESGSVELGEDDWDTYLTIEKCYKENPRLIKIPVVKIIRYGCKKI